jgi:hypothetical protein
LPNATAADAASVESTSSSRALIPLSPVRNCVHALATVRHPAAFLAHLIATRQTLPQTREKRRAEPKIASAVYAGARSLAPMQIGHALSRVA